MALVTKIPELTRETGTMAIVMDKERTPGLGQERFIKDPLNPINAKAMVPIAIPRLKLNTLENGNKGSIMVMDNIPGSITIIGIAITTTTTITTATATTIPIATLGEKSLFTGVILSKGNPMDTAFK